MSIYTIVLSMFVLFAVSIQADAYCYNRCRFSFCPPTPGNAFSIGKPDRAFTPAICDPTGKIVVGHVDSTGEAYVQDGHRYVRISQYKKGKYPTQHFSPSFFKSYNVCDHKCCLSGVGHETIQDHQDKVLDGLCVILPLKAYQVLDRKCGNVIDNVHPHHQDFTECVAFQTKYP